MKLEKLAQSELTFLVKWSPDFAQDPWRHIASLGPNE